MIENRTSRPARFRKAVVLACDKGFFPYAVFLISQIINNNAALDFDLCLCSAEDFVLPPHFMDAPIRVCKLDIPEAIENAPGSDRISFASYLRILLPTVFAEDYDRILYLDADIFMTGGEISRLLDIKLLPDHVIAAVRTSHQRTQILRLMPEFKRLKLDPAPYFNAGVLLIDVQRWLRLNILDRLLNIIASHPEALIMHDQSALNIALRGQWSELSFVWNWMYSGRFSYLIEAYDPFFIHFAGSLKPWSTLSGEFPQKYPNAYRDFFLKNFPGEAKVMTTPLSISAAAKFHRKSLLKQWYDFNKLMVYMRRFDDPYEVLDPCRD